MFQKNTELQVFLACTNGFGDEGGRAIVTALRQNNSMKELDLGTDRLNDSVLKLLGGSLDVLTSLEAVHVSRGVIVHTNYNMC